MILQIFYIFAVIVLEQNFLKCGAREKQYIRKSLYYPYKTTHKSIYLKYRRQQDYDTNVEPTTSIYLPNFDKNITTEESQAESGSTSSLSSLPSSSSSIDTNTSNTSFINTTTSFINTSYINNTTTVNDTDVNENVTTSILEVNSTTTVVVDETETLVEGISVTSSLLSPPTFEAFSPGMKDENKNYSELISTTTLTPIVKEINELSQKDGYFTASLIVLFRTLMSMNKTNARCVLGYVNSLAERLESENQFSIFVGPPAKIFLNAVQALAVQPADVMRNQLQYAIYGIENRKSFLYDDTNTLIDIIDTVYLERDAEDIARVLEELRSSSCSSSKTSKTLVEELIKAFVFTPFGRVEGTARENVISAGINHIMDYRFKDRI